jgi:hypothetical protein
MKTDPGLLSLPSQAVAFLALGMALVSMSGCASKSHVAKKAPYPAPHVVDVSEIMQRDAAKARARELINSGKYKDYAEARRAAEKEYPPEVNQSDGTQEAEYYRWKKQQQVQSKFEADLDKMKRKS